MNEIVNMHSKTGFLINLNECLESPEDVLLVRRHGPFFHQYPASTAPIGKLNAVPTNARASLRIAQQREMYLPCPRHCRRLCRNKYRPRQISKLLGILILLVDTYKFTHIHMYYTVQNKAKTRKNFVCDRP